jgi:hypothetical protein
MGHESFDRDEAVRGSSDRAFGLVFTTVFVLIGLLPWVFGRPVRTWSIVAAVLFLAVALAAPRILAPLNKLWLKFGLLLHRVVSPIVLGIMFFLVITPMGLLMKALGKDPLRLRFDRDASTYWIAREPPGPPADSFSDQF